MNRVIYQNNPLIEVILQIRFPTNLSISNDDPVKFQQGISSLFPIYLPQLQNEQEITFETINTEIQPVFKNRSSKNHTFITKDGVSKITLTNSTISISTLKYTRWEDFFQKFKEVVNIFIEVYKPQFFERIGLRYIDAYKKKELNLDGVSWTKLINQPWIGVLSSIDEKKAVISTIDTEFKKDEKSTRIKVHSGLGRLSNYPDLVFIIDSDFINISNIDIDDWISVSEKLHDYSDEFYQDTITEKLKEQLKPIPIGAQ